MKFDVTQSFEKHNKEIKARRLIQVFWLCEITFLIVLIQRVILGQPEFIYIFFVGCVSLLPVYFLAVKGKLTGSISVLLTVLTIVLSYLMWDNEGVRDEALLGFPGVLIFAAMNGHFRLFMSLLFYMFATIITIGFLASYGYIEFEISGTGLASSFVAVIILSVIAYSIWLVAKDLHRALKNLHEEHRQVAASHERIAELVMHDQLTQLPNRNYASELFTEAMRESEDKNLSVVVLDIDNFKAINELLGHDLGDEVIKRVSKRLRNCLRDYDILSRQGGDEFMIILRFVRSTSDLLNRLEEILASFNRPFKMDDNRISVTASLGAAMAPFDGTKMETLLRKADIAMYKAKDNGRNTYVQYVEQMDTQIARNLQLSTSMRHGLERNEFELYYQPKMDLLKNSINSAEALLRWHHPEFGTLKPESFIQIAESSGLIVEIDTWVMMEACRHCQAWNKESERPIAVAVNVSPILFKRSDLVNNIEDALRLAGLPPHLLEIELTESVLMADPPNLRKVLNEIKSLGVTIAIDDFGIGYSNLSYLKHFNVDTIKIDKSFIEGINNESVDKNIVKSVVDLATSLNLHSVAEGVETPEALEIVKGLGCEMAQGYVWQKPCDIESFCKLLREESTV